jgi:hypothetical protein
MFARVLACVIFVTLISPELWSQAVPTTHWCAAPRPNEPLLREANHLGTSNDSVWASKRALDDVARVSRDQVVQVRDEAICKQAAEAYGTYLRRYVSQDWKDTPVLVVRIGERYLVDDLRSREGPDAYWEVMVFTKEWRRKASYGGGA